MKVKVKIQDDLSLYLQRLASTFNKEKPDMLRTATRKVTGEYGNPYAPIPSRMSTKFNPNLYLSGQEEDRWLIEEDGFLTSLYVNYTGMTYQRRFVKSGSKVTIENTPYTDNYFRVWWEFDKSHDPNKKQSERVLDRDYAYFQETGQDPWAKDKFAKHKWGIRYGLASGFPQIMISIEEYLEQIMKKAE